VNRYHEYYLDQTRLILLTKYNYSSFSDIQNFGRLDLKISIKDNKQIISSFSALLLLTNKGPYSFKSIGSGNHYKSLNVNEKLPKLFRVLFRNPLKYRKRGK
jgi:hypothetical protein